uniref:CSON012365 protein n=1 Tax=Culicoides sonorensis TaxID=179676 RepID=A0A336M5A1_CULSO
MEKSSRYVRSASESSYVGSLIQKNIFVYPLKKPRRALQSRKENQLIVSRGVINCLLQYK